MIIKIAENEKCQTKLDMVSLELNELNKNLNNDAKRNKMLKMKRLN
jgi:hypothetical protein